MLATDFLTALKRSPSLKPAYYFYGEETFFFRRSLGRLRGLFKPQDRPTIDHVKFDFSSNRIVSHLSTLGLFAGNRMAVVYGCESLGKKDQKVFADYLADPAPNTLLILRDENWRAPAWPSAKGGIQSVDCRPARGPDLARFSRAILKEIGVELEDAALRWMLDRTGDSLAEVEQCAQRIAWLHPKNLSQNVSRTPPERRSLKAPLQAGPLRRETIFPVAEPSGSARPIEHGLGFGIGSESARPLDVGAIRDCVSDTAEKNAFQLADAVLAADPTAAFGALEKLIQTADSPLMLIGGMASSFRKAGGVGGRFYSSEGARISQIKLDALLGALSRADVALKSSRLPDESVMRGLVLELLRAR